MRIPRLVVITQILTAKDPTVPNDSPTIPAYVTALPELVHLNINSTVKSVIIATNTITINPGITPKTFIVAGIDIIPAPTIVVDMLNTAPEIVPFCGIEFSCCSCSGCCGKRGETISVIKFDIELFLFDFVDE